MEKMNYKVELVDNGIIVTDLDEHRTSVYQEKEEDESFEATCRGIADTIGLDISHHLVHGTECSFKIKVEIEDE